MRIKMDLNRQATHGPAIPRERGFTLIEVAITILIVGVMIIPLVTMYDNYLLQRKIIATKAAISYSASIIAQFPSANGRYPCPSDRSIAPGAAGYGVEQYTAIPNCTTGTEGICRTNGARDTDLEFGEGVADTDAAPDPVIIGGIPFATLNLGSNMGGDFTHDAWGNRLTYAVSDRLCNPAKTSTTGDYRRGVIAAVDEFGQPTAGIGTADMDSPPDGFNDPNGQFVVLSHGSDGAGAFTYDGAQVAPCNVGTVDAENCDNDFTFASAIGHSKGNTPQFYDDLIYLHLYQSNELWSNIPDGSGISTPHIWNRNSGNVGVLTDTPATRLHVNGPINAATVRSDLYCYKDGSDCFNVNFLGTSSASNTCGTGQVITALGNNTITCGKPAIAPPATEQRCPLGEFLRGIKSNGEILCIN